MAMIFILSVPIPIISPTLNLPFAGPSNRLRAVTIPVTAVVPIAVVRTLVTEATPTL